MVLGVLLCYFSVRLVWSSGMELADSVSKDIADKVRNEILETRDVCRLTELKIRKVGEKTFVRATVQVPDYMGLEEAHDLSSNVEAGIKSKLGNADVAIHTEPFETELSTVKLVENLAMEVAGVRGAHDVNVAYADARLYITLHAYVDAKLPIEQAHEIAERVEQKVRRKMRDVEDITVHIEPFSKIELKGTTVDEREIRTIIHKVADNYKDAFRVRRIVTYVADKKRYINIDCRFTKQISIEEAHEITSKIEEQIQKHFVETTATVHAEPS
jgi:divalent metal cation (Fe/Co/Zn/Cd) transporter